MKVIFLDHDGVMCLSQQWGGRVKKKRKYCSAHGSTPDNLLPVECRFDNFDEKAVKVLNSILEETGAEIVVSSDWKLYANLEEMKDLFTKYNVIKTPIAFTPNLVDFDKETADLYAWKGWNARARIQEIRKYLEEHTEVEKWVAVDDLEMGREGLENCVLTPNSNEGIKQLGIRDKILNYLK